MKKLIILLFSFLLFSLPSLSQVTKIANVTELRKRKGSANAIAELQGYYTQNDGGGQQVIWNATSTKTDNGGTVFQVTGVSVGRWESLISSNNIDIRKFGAKNSLESGNENFNSTFALTNAITSLRKNTKNINVSIGGTIVNAGSSGIIIIPNGVFRVDSLLITQDLSLKIIGMGSRRTNNAIRGVSTILFIGANNKFGLKAEGNGARGCSIDDLDLCYESSAFTGDIIDVNSSPGFTMNRVFLGTFGIQGSDRLRTARSCLRTSYTEFNYFTNCVFDGAVNGWWIDDERNVLDNIFGGFNTEFSNCTFYDFTNAMIFSASGTKTKISVKLNNCAFNPITQNCVRAIDVNNINGLNINNCIFTPSTTSSATQEWIRLVNVTGTITNNQFNTSKVGTISGYINVVANSINCTDGLTCTGGIITGGNNKFTAALKGWSFAPTLPLSFVLNPDYFKPEVGQSYVVEFDYSSLNGIINYDNLNDGSANGFSNTSSRVIIANVSNGQAGISSSSYTIPIKLTGKTLIATGTVSQVFVLPSPQPGMRFVFFKPSSQTLTLNCNAGSNFYRGTSAVSNNLVSSTEIGSLIEIESYASVGWKIVSIVGNWQPSGTPPNYTSKSLINTMTDTGEILQVTGNAIIKTGTIEISDLTKGVILKSPNSTRWLIKVNDSGVLTTTAQ